MANIYVNLDAHYLYDLGMTMIDGGELESGMHLCDIAKRVQSMDDKLMLIQTGGEFAAGVTEAYRRLHARSTLPEVAATEPSMDQALRAFKGQVKKIPKGVSGIPLGETPAKKGKAPKLNIKIILQGLMKNHG